MSDSYLISSGEGVVVIGDRNYPVDWVYTETICGN